MAIPIVQAAGMRIVGATERVRYALPGEQVDGGAAHPVVIVTDADIAAGSLNGAWTVSALAIFPFALSEAQRLGILAYWQIIYGFV